MRLKALTACWDHINEKLANPGDEFEMPEAQAKSLIEIKAAEEVKAVVKPKAE